MFGVSGLQSRWIGVLCGWVFRAFGRVMSTERFNRCFGSGLPVAFQKDHKKERIKNGARGLLKVVLRLQGMANGS